MRANLKVFFYVIQFSFKVKYISRKSGWGVGALHLAAGGGGGRLSTSCAGGKKMWLL